MNSPQSSSVLSGRFQRTTFADKVDISANWKAKDRNNGVVEFESLVGRPTVVVIFRGHGCFHCVQQLGEIENVESSFRKRGVKVVALSNESVGSLDEALKSRPLPFTVLTDTSSKLAKSLGSEKTENWHGILLLDSQGKASWLVSGSSPLLDLTEVIARIDESDFVVSSDLKR